MLTSDDRDVRAYVATLGWLRCVALEAARGDGTFRTWYQFLVMSAHRGKVFDERLPSMKWFTLHCCYIIGHETMQCIDSCQAVTSAIGRLCCKSRKSNDSENLAKVDFWTALPKVHGRFCVRRCGPSRRRARNASAILKNFVSQPKKTFATQSARNGPDPCATGNRGFGCRPGLRSLTSETVHRNAKYVISSIA
jgi:hypothetical protein